MRKISWLLSRRSSRWKGGSYLPGFQSTSCGHSKTLTSNGTIEHASQLLEKNRTLNPPTDLSALYAPVPADISVAEEARLLAEELSCKTIVSYDVGVAGIHRLYPELSKLLDTDVLIVLAGREGALPTIVAGLTDIPVIGVPVSTGYGLGGRGEAALLAMLQSCSVLAVVNVDAGFVAGAFAAKIANRAARTRQETSLPDI